MLLKNGREVNPIRRRSGGVMQRGEENVLLQAAGVRFDALQNARMKRMEKIAVAQEKADHFRAALKNSASLRVGAESQAPNGFKDASACFPAHLRAGIQHAGNRSYADGSGLRDLANRRFPWNCFHGGEAPFCFGAFVWFGRD